MASIKVRVNVCVCVCVCVCVTFEKDGEVMGDLQFFSYCERLEVNCSKFTSRMQIYLKNKQTQLQIILGC